MPTSGEENDLDKFADELARLIEQDATTAERISRETLDRFVATAIATGTIDQQRRSRLISVGASVVSILLGLVGAAMWSAWLLGAGIALAAVSPVCVRRALNALDARRVRGLGASER